MVTLEYLKKNPPQFHRLHNGELTSTWKIDNHTIDLLDRSLKPGIRTVETGAGLSTVIFALHGTNHRCIVPDAELVQRVRAFCREHDIATEQIRFDILPSQDIIASLEQNTYDLALIDGTHNFPIAFIDFFYAARGLKNGGT